MSTIDDLEVRNAVFARGAFSPKDSLMPAPAPAAPTVAE